MESLSEPLSVDELLDVIHIIIGLEETCQE